MSDTRQRRIEVLKTAARRKSEEKTRSADSAIARLIKRGEPVTFQAVQREAGVSHASSTTTLDSEHASNTSGNSTGHNPARCPPTNTPTTTSSPRSPPKTPD
ncbi:MAG TPA: DUF6262 family protein [Mycobacterium sp.]|nr:DUF6262 family protein [Mycobacterium sp.]